MRRATWTLALVAATSARWVDGATCPAGVTAPSVPTLMASPSNPTTSALVVSPDCSIMTVKIDAKGQFLSSATPDSTLMDQVERIDSLPSTTNLVNLGSRLSQGADFSGAKQLTNVFLNSFYPTLMDDLKLPSSVESLWLTTSELKSLDKLNLPEGLTLLTLSGTRVSSLKTLPSSLKELYLADNTFSGVDFPMPPKLEILFLSTNSITALERVVFPDSLIHFACAFCDLVTVRGVKWPTALQKLWLSDNPIETLELRQSDFDLFSGLSELQLQTSQTSCSDREATMKSIGVVQVCVISNARFDALYGDSGTTASPTDKSTEGDSGSTSASNNEHPTGSGSDASGSQRAPGNDIDSSMASTSGLDGSTSAVLPSAGSGTSSRGTGSKAEQSSDASTTTTIVVVSVAVSCTLAVLLAIVGYRLFRNSRNATTTNRYSEANMLALVGTGSGSGSCTSSGNDNDSKTSHPDSSQEYLTNDIRNDKALIPFRIDQSEIALSKQIARGGFGVIYRGVYKSRPVAIKQMLPDAWRNETLLANFMDEIRMCATLTHPKIVEFIGVAWTSLRDISVVIEYMDGGDLYAVMQQHVQRCPMPSPREWFEPWTSTHLHSKASIAKDVAEAVVYLHSFSNPILHRDLKTKNVLLDGRGNAKLSDFGISRELSVDETMTGEVGTSAWIAPEVLRGDRYSERADIYSLGVVLVEMDRCQHPYAGEELMSVDSSSRRFGAASVAGSVAGGGPGGGIGGGVGGVVGTRSMMQASVSQLANKNMHIAMLVSSGQLRPKVSRGCPSSVQSLVDRCLLFDPSERPSAMEVHYELRQIMRY